mmetsp:Transcript_43577/g.61222  ORF Transcript_43577/g.61222 Transcript_43577/m.61222 type:complete len:86 (+) Transcript_43577:190-447(+)
MSRPCRMNRNLQGTVDHCTDQDLDPEKIGQWDSQNHRNYDATHFPRTGVEAQKLLAPKNTTQQRPRKFPPFLRKKEKNKVHLSGK